MQFCAQAWTALSDDLSQASRYDDVVFADENNGWTINSAGQIYNTTDGGLNWEVQYTFPSQNPYLRAVDFIDTETGLVGTLDAAFLRTTDGGETWSDVQALVPGPIPGICGIDHVGQHYYGVGAFFYPAYFIHSPDAGATWEWTDMSAYADGLVTCHFIDENVGFVGGVKESVGAVILKTIDGGDTWTEVYTSNAGTEYIWKFSFPSEDVFYAAVESFTPGTEVAKSIDGGDTWETLTVSEDLSLDIQGIGFVDELHGWVGPRTVPLYETFDGGATWSESTGPTNINRIITTDAGALYASGSILYALDQSTGVFNDYRYPEHGLKTGPNPVSEQLSIDIDLLSNTNVLLGVYTLKGIMLRSAYKGRLPKGSKTFQVNLQDLATGTYLVCLRTDQGFQTLKLIKK